MALSARAAVRPPVCSIGRESAQSASGKPKTCLIRTATSCVNPVSHSQPDTGGSLSGLNYYIGAQSLHQARPLAGSAPFGLGLRNQIGFQQSFLSAGRRSSKFSPALKWRAQRVAAAFVEAVPGKVEGGSASEGLSEPISQNADNLPVIGDSSHAAYSTAGNGFSEEPFHLSGSHLDDESTHSVTAVNNAGESGMPSEHHEETVQVSFLDDPSDDQTRKELARELASVGIQGFSSDNISDGPKTPNESSAEKLAAIMAKNGLDPSEFTEQYEEALAKQKEQRSRRGARALLEQYGAFGGGEGSEREESGLRNRASVALDSAVRGGARFSAEHGLTWPSVVLWGTVLCGAVAAAVWFRSFIWQKWEKQKLEREREGRIMRLNKLKHQGRLDDVEQASKTPPAVVSLSQVREQILASQGVPEQGQKRGGEDDEREMRVFGDEDDVALLLEEELEEEGWVGGIMRRLGLKKGTPAVSASSAATVAPVLDPKAQEDLRQEWERILDAEKKLEAGRFYDVMKPEGAKPSNLDQVTAEPQGRKATKTGENGKADPAGLGEMPGNTESVSSASDGNFKGRGNSFSSLPELKAAQWSLEARVAGMTSPKEKADVLLVLRGVSASVARAPPGSVDAGAFRAWWDGMTAEIAKRSAVKEEDLEGEAPPLSERNGVSPVAENGSVKEEEKRGASSGGVGLAEEPCVSGGGYQDAEWTGTFASTSGRTAAEAADGAPAGSSSLAAETRDSEGPVREWEEPEPAHENGRYLENGASDGLNGKMTASNGAAEPGAKKGKVKVTRIVRKRKKVKAPEPEPEEEGPNTVTGEHPIFGAQYKDGSTEFSRRVQRDFEAEVAADPELRRIRAEIVLNSQEGRSDWDGLELWEKKLYHACEEKHFKRLEAKVRAYIKKEAKARGVDYDKVMGEGADKPRWLTDSVEDQVAAEGDPLIQMDMMRDVLDERLGRKPGSRPRFGPKGIPQEDLEALEQEERRRREEAKAGPAPQAVESSSGVLFPDETIPPDQFSSTLQWAETIKEKEAEAEVSELTKEVSELSDFSETRRWAEELASRDVLSEEEILQAHVDANTTRVPKARLRRKRAVGDPVTPDDFERAKAKARGNDMMQEWDMEEFAREFGVDADAPDDFDPAEYDAAGERVRARMRELLPQIKEMKKHADRMGPNEFLAKHGADLGLDVSVPEARPRMNDGDPRWWTSLPEVQVILLNKSGKFQLLALDLTAEVTGNCYVIGFQDKKEAAWFRDWLSRVPHHATHSPVVQPIGPSDLEEYATRTSSQILVVKRGYARFRPGMTTEQMEFELMGLAEDSTVTAFMEKLLPEMQEMQKKQVGDMFSGDPELVRMMQEAVGAGK